MTPTVHKTVSALATDAIAKYLNKAEKYEKSVVKNRNPEDLHQMRVNLRRLRTVMQVFAPSICLPRAGNEPIVGAIARRLGKLRDLDVIAAALQEHYAPDLPEAERETLAVVLDDLAKQRKKGQKKVKSALKGDRYQDLKASLQDWILNPDCNYTARLDIDQVLPDLTLPLLSRLWLHPGWLIGTKLTKGQPKPDTHLSTATVEAIAEEEGEILHSLRKQVKRVRYQLKVVSEFYGDRLEADLTRLADLQEGLGAIQDSHVMGAFLDDALPDWKTRMPTLKALLADSLHRAWKQWQTLQRHYLDFQKRDDLRQLLMHPGTQGGETEAAPSKRKTSQTTSGKSTATRKSGNRKASQSSSRKSTNHSDTDTEDKGETE